MRIREKVGVLLAAGVAVCAALAAPVSPDSAEGFGYPRIIVHVAGTQAGTVEFDNLDPSFFPDLLTNNDTGELVLPTNYCGLNVEQVSGIWWEDSQGNLVEAENYGEITYYDDAYRLAGQDVTYFYLGGMEFTGPLETCDENPSWYFPGPLSYGGNGPQFGAARLVLELDPPSNYHPTIEFLDHAAEPVELPDLYEDWDPPGGLEEYCEQIPEFCEEEPDPWDASDEMIWGCVARDIWTGLCPSEPEPKEYPSLTLGCMAYATGCDPDPQPRPIETFVDPSTEPEGESLQFAVPTTKLTPASP